MKTTSSNDIRKEIADHLKRKTSAKEIKTLVNQLERLEAEEEKKQKEIKKAQEEKKLLDSLMKTEKFSVLCQEWEESERGWGCRPDGVSIHFNEDDAKQFAKNFWKRQKEICGSSAPSEYTRESGKPFWVYVTKHIYEELKNDHENNGYGLRYGSYSSCLKELKTGERFLIIQD